MNTFPEIMEKLKEKDQLEIVELLHISSDELVEMFSDKIDDYYDKIVIEVDDTENDEEFPADGF